VRPPPPNAMVDPLGPLESRLPAGHAHHAARATPHLRRSGERHPRSSVARDSRRSRTWLRRDVGWVIPTSPRHLGCLPQDRSGPELSTVARYADGTPTCEPTDRRRLGFGSRQSGERTMPLAVVGTGSSALAGAVVAVNAGRNVQGRPVTVGAPVLVDPVLHERQGKADDTTQFAPPVSMPALSHRASAPVLARTCRDGLQPHDDQDAVRLVMQPLCLSRMRGSRDQSELGTGQCRHRATYEVIGRAQHDTTNQ
jgi:hypothetical protein